MRYMFFRLKANTIKHEQLSYFKSCLCAGRKKNPFVWSDNGFPSDWLRSEFFFNVKYTDTGLDYFEFVHSVR